MLAFVKEYPAAVGALGVLLGAVITLMVTWLRERKKSAIDRTDEYLSEQRKICSQLLSKLESLNISARLLGDPGHWMSLQEEVVKGYNDNFNNHHESVRAMLIEARSLADDEILIQCLDNVRDSVATVADLLHRFSDDFWAAGKKENKRKGKEIAGRLMVTSDRLRTFLDHNFAIACVELQGAVVERLKPTIAREGKIVR